jgi:hypothetical protein
MTELAIIDNFLKNPDEHVQEILSRGFVDVLDGDKVFKNIQPLSHTDEFCYRCVSVLRGGNIMYNFARLSPLGQEEPNFIHSDEMMGDLTAILYLSKNEFPGDGTTIYDENDNPSCIINARFNRAILFNSEARHSRNIFNNFGVDLLSSRLIQVCFIKFKQ